MKLLVVGGTSFLGRHTVEVAVACGHEVTVFHRGLTNDDLLAGVVEHRHGDRAGGDYVALDDATSWDAVIDVSAYYPRQVHQLADVLGSRTGHYVHISSISAYAADGLTPDEDAPLAADLADPSVEEVTAGTYGPLKAMCERAALERFGAERTTVVRPTYICGRHDPTDRFTYWARRVAAGGDVAVAWPAAPLQIIDARDVGDFVAACALRAQAGAFDAVGPWAPIGELLTAITPDGAGARLVEVGERTLDEHAVRLPLLAPGPEALMARPGARARAAGLVTRSVTETADETRRWDDERGRPALKVGPTAEIEASLLAAAR